MYDRIKKNIKYFKITITVIVLLTIMAIGNKLFIHSELLNNILGIPLFLLMMSLIIQIVLISKGTRHDIADMSKTLDEILTSKYFAQLRCEPQTKEFKIEDNIITHDKSVNYDYRIYGEMNYHHVEFLHNVRIYEIRYQENREIYKEFVGHVIGYQNDIVSNQNIIIQSPLYKMNESYEKAGYIQQCELDDGSVIYVQKHTETPNMEILTSGYHKIVDIINTHFKTKELIVIIKNKMIWVYFNISSSKGDLLTSSPDEDRLNPNELDDIVNILHLITGATP